MTGYVQQHAPTFGQPPKLWIADQLLLTLSSWREYRTMFHIVADYRIIEPTTCRIIRRVEDTFARSPDLQLPARMPRHPSEMEYAMIIIDATETPIDRKKEDQRAYYSGMKKRHTIKTQIIIDHRTHRIVSVEHAAGNGRNMRLLKQSLSQGQISIRTPCGSPMARIRACATLIDGASCQPRARSTTR